MLSVMLAASKKRSGLLELRVARKHDAKQRLHVCPVCSEICRTATCHQFDETEVVSERKIVLVEQDQFFETAESLQEEIRPVQEEAGGQLDQDELSEMDDDCSQVSGVEPFEKDPLAHEDGDDQVGESVRIEEPDRLELEQEELTELEIIEYLNLEKGSVQIGEPFEVQLEGEEICELHEYLAQVNELGQIESNQTQLEQELYERKDESKQVRATDQIEANGQLKLKQDELSSSEDDSDQEQKDYLQRGDEHEEISTFFVEIKGQCSSCDGDPFVSSTPLVHREDKLVSDFGEESTTELLESHQRRNDELEGDAATRSDAGLESSEKELERFNQPSTKLGEAKELLVALELMDQSEEDRSHRFRPIRSDSSSSLEEDRRPRSEPDLDRIGNDYHEKKVAHKPFTYKGSDVETCSSVSQKGNIF